MAAIGNWLTFAVIVGLAFLLYRYKSRERRKVLQVGLGSGGFLLGLLIGLLIGNRKDR